MRTEEECARYLAAALEEARGDAAFITKALGTVARSHNISQLARDTGLTREGLYKALSPEGNASFGTVLKVMHALGVQLAVSAIPKRKPSARKQAKPVAKRKGTAAARRQV